MGGYFTSANAPPTIIQPAYRTAFDSAPQPTLLTASAVHKVHAAVGSGCHQALPAVAARLAQQRARQQGSIHLQVVQAAALPHILHVNRWSRRGRLGFTGRKCRGGAGLKAACFTMLIAGPATSGSGMRSCSVQTAHTSTRMRHTC